MDAGHEIPKAAEPQPNPNDEIPKDPRKPEWLKILEAFSFDTLYKKYGINSPGRIYGVIVLNKGRIVKEPLGILC